MSSAPLVPPRVPRTLPAPTASVTMSKGIVSASSATQAAREQFAPARRGGPGRPKSDRLSRIAAIAKRREAPPEGDDGEGLE